jgi:hypothetical protein
MEGSRREALKRSTEERTGARVRDREGDGLHGVPVSASCCISTSVTGAGEEEAEAEEAVAFGTAPCFRFLLCAYACEMTKEGDTTTSIYL